MSPKQFDLYNVSSFRLWRRKCKFLANLQMIKSQNHFGQYGNIESVIYAAGNNSKSDDS